MYTMSHISLTRKCPYCNRDITKRSWKAKYCSETCKWKFNNSKQRKPLKETKRNQK